MFCAPEKICGLANEEEDNNSTQTDPVGYWEVYGMSLFGWSGLFSTGLLVQFEYLDLNEFGYGQIFQAAALHAAHEFGRDVEDSDLDKLVKTRLESKISNLANLLAVNTLHLEADEFVRIGLLVAHADEALCVRRINLEDP